MSKVVLELNKICKTFRNEDGSMHQAVKNVSLSVSKGEVVGIVGGSGCGKSTLARMITKLIPSTEGQIVLMGNDVTEVAKKDLKDYYQNVQMVFQNPLDTFSPRMKIGTYLIEPFVNFGICQKAEARKKAETLLEMVGLSKADMQKRPDEMSGGQLQRVVIARAIGLNPSLIICDEATSALDVTIQKQIVDLLTKLQEEHHFACLFITHDLALAENLCDRIHVMQKGEVVEVFEGGNIQKNAKHMVSRRLIQVASRLHCGVHHTDEKESACAV